MNGTEGVPRASTKGRAERWLNARMRMTRGLFENRIGKRLGSAGPRARASGVGMDCRGKPGNDEREAERLACQPKLRCSLVVPLAGIEPARCCHHQILSLARLPVPPQGQWRGL